MRKQLSIFWVLFLCAAVQLTSPKPVFALAAVDLNTASEKELETLPGVGPKTAQEIIAARPLKSVDDLKGIKGIGEKKFEKLKGLVTVSSTAPSTATSSGATTTGGGAPATKLKQGEKININTASLEDLDRLPGIGPQKAKAIVDGRPYKSVDDLLKVKGIKQATLSKIRNYVTVD